MPRMGIYSPVPQPLLAVSSGAQARVPMPQRPCFPQRPWSSSEFKKIDNLAQSRRGAEMQNRFKINGCFVFCSLCASASRARYRCSFPNFFTPRVSAPASGLEQSGGGEVLPSAQKTADHSHRRRRSRLVQSPRKKGYQTRIIATLREAVAGQIAKKSVKRRRSGNR